MKLYFTILQFIYLTVGSLIQRDFEKCYDLIDAGNLSAAKIELARLYKIHGINSLYCMKCEYLIQRKEKQNG